MRERYTVIMTNREAFVIEKFLDMQKVNKGNIVKKNFAAINGILPSLI